MCDKNLLPNPSPVDAPRTSPAMSTSRNTAGRIFSVSMYWLMVANRASGTSTMPTLGSIVQNG